MVRLMVSMVRTVNLLRKDKPPVDEHLHFRGDKRIVVV